MTATKEPATVNVQAELLVARFDRGPGADPKIVKLDGLTPAEQLYLAHCLQLLTLGTKAVKYGNAELARETDYGQST